MSSPEHLTPRSESDPERPDETDGAEAATTLELAGFVLRSARRRRRLATVIFVLGGLMTAAIALFAPRVYKVDTRILAQRQVIMPLLGNPRRTVPPDADAPLKAVDEIIRRRDNLVAVVRETNLIERWQTGRSPVLKLKDALVRGLLGPMSEEEMTRALLEVLDEKLTVQAAETRIVISLRWHDPQVAFEIVSSLEEHFLRDRSSSEAGAIAETIAILQEEAAEQRVAIDAAMADVREHVRERVEAAPQAPRVSAPRRGAPARLDRTRGRAPSAPDRTDVAAELAEKRRAIQTREDAGQRRLAELEAQLVDLRVTYTPAHPAVIVLEEKIRQASIEPPALVKLKQAERELLDQARSLAPEEDAPSGLPAAPARRAITDKTRDEEPEVITARARLLTAVREYEELNERTDAARIELRTAEAAFKYRYAVVEPPEVPRKPVRFNVALVLLGGLALSVAAAICAACAGDLASNRFIEPWQARRLPIPLLAEVDEPCCAAGHDTGVDPRCQSGES